LSQRFVVAGNVASAFERMKIEPKRDA
jgi:hypothetical protein